MNGLRCLKLITISILLCGAPLNVTHAQELTPADARSIAKEAYIFGAAYVNNYRMYVRALVDNKHPLRLKLNEFVHLRRLVGPEVGDTPNRDTLYSYTILDLRREPVVISVPKVPKDRLYLLQMGDVTTETLPYISSIATGTDPGNYIILGPDYSGRVPLGKFDGVIVSRGQFVTVKGRTAVKGEQDLPSVSAIQDGYRVVALSEFLGTTPPSPAANVEFLPWSDEKAGGIGFFDYMNMALAWQLPTLQELPMLARFARIGVIPGERFTTQGMSEQIIAALREGIKDAKKAIAERATTLQKDAGGGWLFGTDDISRFGDDYLLRAAVSATTIYRNSADHALYAVARHDKDGNSLHGENKYTIHFESKQLPPVNGFWSLTLYDAETKAMAPNALERYSLGDRTRGLVYGEDGSLNICVQWEEPKAADCNWLPAPDCQFYLVMRLYAPKTATIEQGWTPPAITPAQ